MHSLGFNNIVSIYGSLALTFSSTIIILKLLSDRGDLDKLYGKISTGFLLVQDIVAAVVLLVVSIIGKSSFIVGNTFISSVLLFIKGALFFFIIYIVSKYVLPKISSFLSNSQELLFLFSISWGLGLATIFYLLGFSIEIGALAAGVALSSFKFSQEIASRMKPLRDFFILLFFIMLGSQIIFTDILNIIIHTSPKLLYIVLL